MSDKTHPAPVTFPDFSDAEDGEEGASEPTATHRAFGAWVVDSVLSRGLTTSVYACHNQHAPRIRAAIKAPSLHCADDPAVLRRFQREATLLARVNHPHIVPVRNARLDHHPPFIEMPLVQGPTLQTRLADGPLSPDELQQVTTALRSAVAHLEAQGIHHRDLKPANVICGGDGPVLIDFGLATTTASADREPLDGVQGSPGYLPPEWSPGAVVPGAAWDRYSLGVVLYECAVGRPAFPVDPTHSPLEQVFAVQQAVAGTVSLDPGPEVPPEVRALVMQLTHCDPSLRGALSTGNPEPPDHTVPSSESVHTSETLEMLVEPRTETLRPSHSLPRWGGLALGGLGAVVGLGYAASTMLLPPSERPQGRQQALLSLELDPPTSPLPVALLFDGIPVSTGFPVSPGQHRLQVRVGTDCGTGPLPSWCTEATETIQVADAERGLLPVRTVAVPEVRPHPLRVDVSGDRPARARVGKGAWVPCGEDCRVEVLPGPQQQVVVQSRDCPDEPCGDTCPDLCGEVSVALEVPVQPKEALRVSAVLPTRRSPAPAPTRAEPTGAEKEGTAQLGRPITVADFQAFLRGHPEYAPGGAMARQKADEKYLPGWEGEVPVDRFTGRPLAPDALVEGLSPAVAAAYCASRGGVARIGDGPALLHGRAYELRQTDAGWVGLDAAGAQVPATEARRSLRHFTVRCRR